MLEIPPWLPKCYPHCACEPAGSGLILQPWAFWTTFAYIIAAIAIYRWHREKNRPELRIWFVSIHCVALASFLCHAFFNHLTLATDCAGIVVFTWSIHLGKFRDWRTSSFIALALFVGASGLYYFVPMDHWQTLSLTFFFGSAWVLVQREGWGILKERPFLAAMAIYGLSFLLFKYDRHPLLCDFPGIPYGHPTWHVGSAITTFLFGKWWFGRDR